MNKLYEALEVCLNEIEQGADVNTVLSRYPELADELRPILETSMKAKKMAVPAPSQDVLRRNRAKLLQHASDIRERKSAPASHRIWSVPLRRALVSLVVVIVLFASSTGLVRASSNTLPGDNLYPVKRTWEDVLLFFTFDTNKREALELEHENERLDELQELFAEGRSANVDFAGYVTRQSGTEWRVAGITILITPETRLPTQTVEVGAAVHIVGKVQSGSNVIAERIELLAPGSIVPEVDDNEEYESESDDDEAEGLNQPGMEVPVTGSAPEATVVPAKTSTPKFHPEDVSLEGVVTSLENNFIVVKGVVMNIQFAEIEGTPSVGATAKIEGYYDASGVFIVTKIEFETTSLNSGSGSSNSNTSNENSNDDNSNDDHSDDNEDHSGSGGGGGGDD